MTNFYGLAVLCCPSLRGWLRKGLDTSICRGAASVISQYRIQFAAMSKKRFTSSWMNRALVVWGLCVTSLVAGAATVTTRFGSQDGFGIGIRSGDAFLFEDLVMPSGEGTDEWIYGGLTAQLSSSWTGNLQDAQLQVFSGGWGLDGPAGVYLNGVRVGALSDGDNGAGDLNHAYLDTFDLQSFLNELTGLDSIEIRAANPDDGGVVGFIQLSLQTQDAPGSTVPEPASLALAAVALAGVALTTRRRRRD